MRTNKQNLRTILVIAAFAIWSVGSYAQSVVHQTTTPSPTQHNTLIGSSTGGALIDLGTGATRGWQNVFVGASAGLSATTGMNNTFIGTNAGANVQTGSNNSFFGSGAGATVQGDHNTFLGTLAGRNPNGQFYTSNRNVFIGAWAGRYMANTSEDNVMIGTSAGHQMSGSGNVFLGQNAGHASQPNQIGNNNVFIGRSAGSHFSSGDNQLVIHSGELNSSKYGAMNPALIEGHFADRQLKFGLQGATSRLTIYTSSGSNLGMRFLNALGQAVPSTTASTRFLTLNGAGDLIMSNLPAVSGGPDISIFSHDGTLNTTTASTATSGLRTVTMGDSNLFFNTGSSPFVDGTVGKGRIYIGSAVNNFPILSSSPSDSHYRLLVEGGILTEKIKVALHTTANWADYVFADDYNLMPLNEVESFIKTNKHLPGIESAEELQKSGLDLADMQRKQMEKIEELTLHLIEQGKVIESQKREIKELQSIVKSIVEINKN